MRLPFLLPPQASSGRIPVWEGRGFRVGNDLLPVLEYGSNWSGWTDDLTMFHEETAGSNHFMDRASRQHALEQICRHVCGDAPVLLEVGCSSGFMINLMREHLPRALVMGADVVRRPLERLASDMPDVPLFRFDLVDCPLPDNSVDAVVLLNVLEHIEDDLAAMRQIYRILKVGGIAVIEVPAGPNLYDVYDKLLMHFRRYTIARLRGLAGMAQFRIVEQSHLGFFLYPGFWLIKQRNKRFLAQDEALYRQTVEQNIRDTGTSRFFKGMMQLELALGKWMSYPCGIRCLLTCRRVEA